MKQEALKITFHSDLDGKFFCFMHVTFFVFCITSVQRNLEGKKQITVTRKSLEDDNFFRTFIHRYTK